MYRNGPWFNGGVERALDAFLDEARTEIAQQGVNDVKTATGVFRNPTGYYRSQIQTDRRVGSTAVTDGGAVYGPWLEGTSSRNRTTRFKGYRIFRRITRHLRADAAPIAERVLHRYLGRMQ